MEGTARTVAPEVRIRVVESSALRKVQVQEGPNCMGLVEVGFEMAVRILQDLRWDSKGTMHLHVHQLMEEK